MRTALVYNPRAGLILRKPSLVANVIAALRGSYGDVVATPTTGPHTAGALARAAADDGAELVVVWGGDGTVNEAVQSLAGSGVPLGVLPGGTACVLTRELGLGAEPLAAARLLSRCEPREIAAGRLLRGDGSSHLFLLMAGIGFDARIVHGLDLELKDRVGKLAYWRGAFRELGTTLEEFDVEVDGERRRCAFALVSRVRYYGGAIPLAKRASILSEKFEVILIRRREVWRYPFYFLALLCGTPRLAPGLEVVAATRVRATPQPGDRVHVQVDGEYAGTIPASFEIAPAAIRLLVPKSFRG